VPCYDLQLTAQLELERFPLFNFPFSIAIITYAIKPCIHTVQSSTSTSAYG
jgi:hypothetical protein